APPHDGGLLIWPDGEELLRQIASNQKRLQSLDRKRICGVPLPEVRQAQREWLGHVDATRPIIATGHQTELYHPGVWVKNAVIDATAQRVGGEAIQFAVDTDEPKHLYVRWPGTNIPITDDPSLKS